MLFRFRRVWWRISPVQALLIITVLGITVLLVNNISIPTRITPGKFNIIDERLRSFGALADTNDDKSLLTLFTAMTESEPDFKSQFYLNTIKNWASMMPWVQPVLFVKNVSAEIQDTSSWGYLASKEGWRIQAYSRTLDGAPVLKTMFADALKLKLNTEFIGYANPNILFPKSTRDTLRSFDKKIIKSNVTVTGILISGSSRTVTERLLNTIVDPYLPDHVQVMTHESEPFKPVLADYFITTKDEFPWERTPDFVVGRPLYDVWFIQKAVEWGLTHMDASETIPAGHQTTGPKNTGTTGIHTKSNWYINMGMMDEDAIMKTTKHSCSLYYSAFKEKVYGLLTEEIDILKRDEDRRALACGLQQ